VIGGHGADGTNGYRVPTMQAPASFNLDAVKTQVEEMIKAHAGQ